MIGCEWVRSIIGMSVYDHLQLYRVRNKNQSHIAYVPLMLLRLVMPPKFIRNLIYNVGFIRLECLGIFLTLVTLLVELNPI